MLSLLVIFTLTACGKSKENVGENPAQVSENSGKENPEQAFEELSRDQAAKIISASLGYPKFETVAIEKRYMIDYKLVREWNGSQRASGNCARGPRFIEFQQALQSLQEKGLLTIGKEQVEGTNCITNFARIELTKEGHKYLLEASNSEFKLRTSNIVVDKVTGIVRPKGSASALVEFTEARREQTPFYAILGTNFNSRPYQFETKSVSFALYDDGWRARS